MTNGAARLSFFPDGPHLAASPGLPVEALLLGKPVEEAAALLPRLFNLCPMAQGTAARLSLGLQSEDESRDLPALRAEILRGHLVQLCAILPRALDMTPLPLPVDPWTLLNGRPLPASVDPAHWDGPLAPMVHRLARLFAPGEACTPVLPVPPPTLATGAFENSAAGRQAAHPALKQIERTWGRGPLWRLLGLVADLEAALLGSLPPPRLQNGIALVPAARGTYALRLTHAQGRITGAQRRTPTDHILAPGGALLSALATLPAAKRGLAPLIIALHDPCVPVTLAGEVLHA